MQRNPLRVVARSACLVALLLVAAAVTAAAQGSFGADFIRVPQEPVGRSLAGAHLGQVSGAAAMAWNPAGLGYTPGAEAVLSHATWTAGTAAEWGALALPVAGGGVGLACGVFRSGALDGYLADGTPTGEFTPTQLHRALGYGRTVARRLQFGAALEGALEDDGQGHGYQAWAANLGGQYTIGRLELGLAALHLGPDVEAGGEPYPLPLTLRGGGSYRVAQRAHVHAAAEWVAQEAPRLLFAGSWGPSASLTALAGARLIEEGLERAVEPTFGLTLDLGPTVFAYGYLPERNLEASHQLSLGLRLGRSP